MSAQKSLGELPTCTGALVIGSAIGVIVLLTGYPGFESAVQGIVSGRMRTIIS